MPYTVKVQVKNSGTSPLRTVVYGGTVFEVLDPYNGVQNLAAATTVTAIVPPGTAQIIEVPAFCMNHKFRSPSGTPMRPTSLSMTGQFDSQSALWEYLDKRT
jgi:hypothetical protein